MMDIQDWEPPSEAEMKLIEARRERSDKISKLMSGYLLKGHRMLGVVCAECDTILLQDRQGIKYCVACSELDSDTDKDNPLINQSAAMSMVKEMELSTLASDTKTKGTAKTVSPGLSQCNPNQAGAEGGRSCEVTPSVTSNAMETQSWSLNRDRSKKEETGAAPEQYTKQETLVHSTDSDSGFPSISESHFTSCPQQNKRQVQPSHHTVVSNLSTLESSLAISITNLLEKIEWAGHELKDTTSVEYSIHLCQFMKAAAEAVVAVKKAML
uniref:Uncharacterized protein n=2 Tax=Arion vulgaris TaxID=1028688 RepID=A0A0B6ZPT7_9EUPU